MLQFGAKFEQNMDHALVFAQALTWKMNPIYNYVGTMLFTEFLTNRFHALSQLFWAIWRSLDYFDKKTATNEQIRLVLIGTKNRHDSGFRIRETTWWAANTAWKKQMTAEFFRKVIVVTTIRVPKVWSEKQLNCSLSKKHLM